MTKSTLLLLSVFVFVQLQAQELYDIDVITEINITFDDPSWDATMDTYYANDMDELLFGSCTINGIQFDSVGVAYKGNSTYSENNLKNPLKIKLAEVYDFQNYHGCQTLKLSNGFKDPSFVREVLSYEIGRKYMEMPLSNYAKVYINSSYYGLFVSSESINGDYMEKRFYCDDDNTRVKCNPVYGSGSPSLEYLGADSSLYYDSYEMKSDFGWGELMDLTNQLAYNTADIETYLDVDAALWMIAFDNVLVNLDSYIGPLEQNYYLIQDDNGRFHPVIWDLNECIGGFTNIGSSGGGPPQPSTLNDLTDLSLFLRETDTGYPLIYFLFQNTRYRKMFVAHAKTILEENISNGWYYTRAQELQTIIDTEVQSEPNGFYTYMQFTSNLDSQQGSGMGGGTYGLSELMGPRDSYLSGLPVMNLTAPTITNINCNPTNPLPNTSVVVTADIQNATYAYVGYRSYKADAFEKIEMFDDGAHDDGAAADGIWGATITVGAANVQYYIYSDNADAGVFSPVRAEHEFYELSLSQDVVINELMASNNITASDEYGEFNDWIELFNNSGTAVDLGGYYLSDDTANHYKWVIPNGTVINGNDYLIIWADNDLAQLPLHANFKLDASGEYLFLSDPLGNLIDEVQFPKVEDNGTYGRYPNGTGGFIPMYATYNAENSFTAVAIPEEEAAVVAINIYPNPATDVIFVEGLQAEGEILNIYNIQGQVIFERMIGNGETIDVSNFAPGTYLLRFTASQQVKKLMVR